MPSPMQIAVRRNAILRDGGAFLRELRSTMSGDEIDLRLLSAEESFSHDDARRHMLAAQPAVTRRRQSWASIAPVADRLAAQIGPAESVVRLSHFEHCHAVVPASVALRSLRALAALDGDLVTITAFDASGEFQVDVLTGEAADWTVRGAWRMIAAPLPPAIEGAPARRQISELKLLGGRLVVPLGDAIFEPGDDRWRDYSLRYDVQCVGPNIEATFNPTSGTRPILRMKAGEQVGDAAGSAAGFGLDITDEANALGWTAGRTVDVAADSLASLLVFS